MYYGLKCPVFKWPNHIIRPFEKQTNKCPKSQMFGCQALGIQMFTVQ